jgi:LemA protein
MVILGVLGGIVGVLVILFMAVISAYNKLVKFRNLMKEGWSGIDVFLKKRHDVVPNLVETVKGYAAHEKGTFEEITRYRSEAMQAKSAASQIESENQLGKALVNLMAVAENYPDLKANTNFLELQKQLSELENDLEKARRYYNGTVRENNIYVEQFPTNIIAGMFKFEKGLFFEIDSAERTTPQVSF